LRATAHDSYLQQLIDDAGVQSIVTLAPPLHYEQALQEMLTADALLILQSANCNDQIPAKLYECLRAKRPIFALTDPAGDTANALRAAGIDTIAALDSAPSIREALQRFLTLLQSGEAPIASEGSVTSASRRGRTAEFAGLLDRITQSG